MNYDDKTSITVNGKDIMESDNLELLGVTIDCGLNFNLHISNVCKKASQRIGVIMRLRNLIPTEAKLHLFKAAILPHLTYCHLVWHFCRASDTRRLERVQERGKHSIRYIGPRLWSKIPSKERSAASLKQFKTRINSLDLSNILDGCSGCYLYNS